MTRTRLHTLLPMLAVLAMLPTGCSGRSTASEMRAPPLKAVHVLGDSFAADRDFQASLREELPGVVITFDAVGGSSLAEQAERYAASEIGRDVPLVILDGGLARIDGEPLPHIEEIVSLMSGDCRQWLYVEPVERAIPQAARGSQGYLRQQSWVGAVKARHPGHVLPMMDTFLNIEPRSRVDADDNARGWIGRSWRRDAVHLNPEGSAVLARTIASTLKDGGGFSCDRPPE